MVNRLPIKATWAAAEECKNPNNTWKQSGIKNLVVMLCVRNHIMQLVVHVPIHSLYAGVLIRTSVA